MSLVTNADIDEAKRRLSGSPSEREPYALAVYPKATEVALERVSADLEDNAQEVMRLQGELSAARAELAACASAYAKAVRVLYELHGAVVVHGKPDESWNDMMNHPAREAADALLSSPRARAVLEVKP